MRRYSPSGKTNSVPSFSAKPFEHLEGFDAERLLGSVSTMLAEGQDMVEAQLVTRDGRSVPYEFHGGLLENAAGDPVEVPREHVSDWMYFDQDTLRGGFTIAALTWLTEDREARALLARWGAQIDCELLVDPIGNMFLRRAGSDGILYDSVRRAGGENVVIFKPRLLLPVTQGDHFSYSWDVAGRPHVFRLSRVSAP